MESKQCPRTISGSLDPLIRPRMNCVFRRDHECSLHTDYNQYLQIKSDKNFLNRIRNNSSEITLKVRCVLFNEFGMSVAEQRDYGKASRSIQREEIRQCKNDSKLLNNIKKQVSTEFFKDLEYELEESEHWVNLRIIDTPEGTLQKSESNFKVYVDQCSVGDSGDSYSGTVCIELPWKKYLIWDFWM